jgi:type II secretory pathway component HofQ
MSLGAAPVWWIEVIKVSPGLISATLAASLVGAYRNEVRALLGRMTKFKALGLEAEFSDRALEKAIAAQGVSVSADDRRGVLKRLEMLAPLLRDSRVLWVDDIPANTKNERALLESFGVRIDVFTSSETAEAALRSNTYAIVITDLKREGREDEGLLFVKRTVTEKTYVWTIAYVGTDQSGLPRPADLFGITNRPDHLMHYVCDIVEREKL